MIGVRQPAYNSSTFGVLALAWLVPQSRRHTEMKIETDNGEGAGPGTRGLQQVRPDVVGARLDCHFVKGCD